MSTQGPLLDRFHRACQYLHDLSSIDGLLEWDQLVMMPRQGAEQRSRQLASVARIRHDALTDPALDDLVDELASTDGLSEATRADVRELRRQIKRACAVPSRVITERATRTALAQAAWEQAYQHDALAEFAPHFAGVVSITREYAQALDAAAPYDALLDEFEPGMTRVGLEQLFTALQRELTSLLDQVLGQLNAKHTISAGPIACDIAAQERFVARLARDVGFDLDAGRIDRSTHPFTSGSARDVRFTIRYAAAHAGAAIFSALHELGHALYEQGLPFERHFLPAGGSCSLGIHESQSRLFENLVGRSRSFWEHYLPLLQSDAAGTLDDLTLEALLASINRPARSLIRVEADELTYNLHIIVRFRLEQQLISGALEAADVAEAWNALYQEVIGLRPSSARNGVLQDIHWAGGMFGYFPTYALGNLYAAQFVAAMQSELGDLDVSLARGDLRRVTTWLRGKVHQSAAIYPPQELCRRITGGPLTSDAFVRYLSQKFVA